MPSTIKDVAKYAGVSIATVSRVVNHDSNVKAENVAKVLEAIKACNFTPNYVARNLKSARSNTIGLLVSDIANPYFMEMAKVIESQLHRKGYDLLICSTDEDPEKEKGYLNRFVYNRVDGIIVNTTGKNDDFLIQLSRTLPIVLIERQITSSDFLGDYVGANNFNSIYSMTKYLLQLGHQRIGFINSELFVSTGRERMKGFAQAMADSHVDVYSGYPYIFESKFFSYEGGYAGAEHLMNMANRPTAIIASNNTLALGALSYLKQNHVRIPQDISFMHYGDIQNSALLFVELSYSTLNPNIMGERAASFLIDRIESPDSYKRQAIFESQLVIGNSISRAL